jgi:hypothetical protein
MPSAAPQRKQLFVLTCSRRRRGDQLSRYVDIEGRHGTDPNVAVRIGAVPYMGFRQFLLRGLDNVQGEWSLVTTAWNMKRMYAIAAA